MTTKIFLMFILSTSVVNGIWSKKWPVSARGRVTCDRQSMPYVKIELMDKDPLKDDIMGSSRTNGYGRFSVSGSGRDWVSSKPGPIYIRVTYVYDGNYGKMKVVGNFFKRLRYEKSREKPYARYINFGTINFASIHCRAYIQYHKALVDYRRRAVQSLPYPVLHIVTKAIVHGGTPYSTTDTIRIPRSYRTISYTTAKHEFGHTIRHSMDGNMGHFLADVARYGYTRHHSCGKRTNYGFAFNEGWAEFWAGECPGLSYGGNHYDYRYEGNVAQALRRLMRRCKSSYKKMVDVLRANRGKIHSFSTYRSKHNAMYHCRY